MKTKWKPGLCCMIAPQANCPYTSVAICTPCLQATKDSDWFKEKTIKGHFFKRVLKCPECPEAHWWDTKNGF